MSKKNKVEILVEDDDLATIDNALDAAVDNLVGVNERIRELLESIEPPPPQKEGEDAPSPSQPANDANEQHHQDVPSGIEPGTPEN